MALFLSLLGSNILKKFLFFILLHIEFEIFLKDVECILNNDKKNWCGLG